jgi:hypothetical protein
MKHVDMCLHYLIFFILNEIDKLYQTYPFFPFPSHSDYYRIFLTLSNRINTQISVNRCVLSSFLLVTCICLYLYCLSLFTFIKGETSVYICMNYVRFPSSNSIISYRHIYIQEKQDD